MRTDVAIERVRGCLWGGAVGDALGLPTEGLSPPVIARRFGALDRYQLLGRTGFVSDDTEQSALLAQALLEGDDDDAVVRRFRHHLRWWFARLPFGIGFATLRACLKLWLGLARSGVGSGGNGAAMRAGVLGVVVTDRARRVALGRRLAEVTHTHPLAVDGALFVAELAAACAQTAKGTPRVLLVRKALEVVPEGAVRNIVLKALETTPDPAEAWKHLGNTGFVLHSVGLSTWAFVRGEGVIESLRLVIRAGGDTDTHAAIVGGWTGALHGDAVVPEGLVKELAGGPFGAEHLSRLAEALTQGGPPPAWSAWRALARNLALYPVVLAHAFRRLVPLG